MTKKVTGISPARLAAALTLRRLDGEPTTKTGATLLEFTTETKCRPDDERLARNLVFGVLRHGLTLDRQFEIHLKQSSSRLHPVLRTLLRLAVFQKFYLSKIPDYAIVNESVGLAKGVFKLEPRQTGFLNAVLRKIVSAEAAPDPPTGNRIADLSVRYSFPRFVTGMLVEKYGTHKAVAIMEMCNVEPPLTIRVNTLRTTLSGLNQALDADGFAARRGSLCPGALIVDGHADGKSLFETDVFKHGHFYVQDEASQLVSLIVAPKPGETIWDMCSAPGGKATQLAELSAGEARITATDQSDARMRLVEENIARLGSPGISMVALDDVLKSDSQFDVVLVDAPCSGLGTIRRNPEIRYSVNEETLARQHERQLEALSQAADHVRSGGRIVYSTCSFSSTENRETVSKFLKRNPLWHIETGDNPVCGDELSLGIRRADGFYATWPDHPQVDGFEAVVLVNGGGQAEIDIMSCCCVRGL